MPKKTKTTIDDLARMVADGFANTAQKSEVNGRFDSVESRLTFLEVGQEEIRMRLDNAAYKFELVSLEHRVETLENKAGITR